MPTDNTNEMLAHGFKPAYNQALDLVCWYLTIVEGDLYIVFNPNSYSCLLAYRGNWEPDINPADFAKSVDPSLYALSEAPRVAYAVDLDRDIDVQEIVSRILKWRMDICWDIKPYPLLEFAQYGHERFGKMIRDEFISGNIHDKTTHRYVNTARIHPTV